MPNINDFKGIPPITWGFIVFFSIGTIIPGLLLIFLFREDLFQSVETIKLLFLSMGITLPVWTCNTLLLALSVNDGKPNETDDQVRNYMQLSGLLGAIPTIMVLFIPCLIKMFVDISSDTAFYISFSIELILIIAFIYIIRAEMKRK